jgi:hypothetical protein
MTAALNAHPEWNGDWQMPGNIQQALIDTRTGELASADNPYKRTELFINNTAPTVVSDAPTDNTTLPEPNTEPDSGDPNNELLPPAIPAAPPGLTPHARQAPRLEGRGVVQPDGTTRLEGTITLDIDPTTGLIAAPTCPVIRSKTFVIGTEPRGYCGPQYHTGRVIAPSSGATRPRLVSP